MYVVERQADRASPHNPTFELTASDPGDACGLPQDHHLKQGNN
jgi:hypothetical protein